MQSWRVAFGKGDFKRDGIPCAGASLDLECKMVRTDSLWLYFSSMLLGIPPELIFDIFVEGSRMCVFKRLRWAKW